MWPFFPKKCNCPETPTNPGTNCNHDGSFAKDLVYQGEDIPCAEIYSGMNISEVLQRMDYYLCGLEFTQQILNIIEENPQEFIEFIYLVNGAINCETINECGPVPTTTTTSSSSTSTSTTTTTPEPTTTTTTTADTSCTEVGIDAATLCPGQEYALVQYTDCEGNIQTIQTTPGELPIVCMLNSSTPVYLCGTGDFQIGEVCFPTTTTTSSSTSTSTSTTTTTTTSGLGPVTTTTTTTGDVIAYESFRSFSSDPVNACSLTLTEPIYVIGFYSKVSINPSGIPGFDGGFQYWKIKRNIDAVPASVLIDGNGNILSISFCP